MKITCIIVLLASAMSTSATMTMHMGGTMKRHFSFVKALDGDDCRAEKDAVDACVATTSPTADEDDICKDGCVEGDEASLCDRIEKCFKPCISEETAETCKDEISAAEICIGCKEREDDIVDDSCQDADYGFQECIENKVDGAEMEHIERCYSICDDIEHLKLGKEPETCADGCAIFNTCYDRCKGDTIVYCEDEIYAHVECDMGDSFGEGKCDCAAEESPINGDTEDGIVDDGCQDADSDLKECIENKVDEAEMTTLAVCFAACDHREYLKLGKWPETCADGCAVINTCYDECKGDTILACEDEVYEYFDCALGDSFGEGKCDCAAEEPSIKVFAWNLSRTMKKYLKA